MKFDAKLPFIVKVTVDGINAVTGLREDSESRFRDSGGDLDIHRRQDYIVVPSQGTLDGARKKPSTTMQPDVTPEDGECDRFYQFVAPRPGTGSHIKLEIIPMRGRKTKWPPNTRMEEEPSALQPSKSIIWGHHDPIDGTLEGSLGTRKESGAINFHERIPYGISGLVLTSPSADPARQDPSSEDYEMELDPDDRITESNSNGASSELPFLASGNRIGHDIAEDPYDPSFWDYSGGILLDIHVLSSGAFASIKKIVEGWQRPDDMWTAEDYDTRSGWDENWFEYEKKFDEDEGYRGRVTGKQDGVQA